MDNELEIVSNNPVAIPEVSPEVKPVNNALRTVAPVAGGFAAGILACYGIYKVVNWLIAKHKAKKAAKIEVVEEPKKDE